MFEGPGDRFWEEIEQSLAALKPGEIIIPTDVRDPACKPLCYADDRIKRIYTLWCMVENQMAFLSQETSQLIALHKASRDPEVAEKIDRNTNLFTHMIEGPEFLNAYWRIDARCRFRKELQGIEYFVLNSDWSITEEDHPLAFLADDDGDGEEKIPPKGAQH